MNEHERYIRDFKLLLDGMSYWGRAIASSPAAICRAAQPASPDPRHGLRARRRHPGAGTGDGRPIVAIDLDEEALAAVARSASAAGLSQVTTLCANMAALPAELAPADPHLGRGERLHHRGGQRLAKHGGRTLPALLPAWC